MPRPLQPMIPTRTLSLGLLAARNENVAVAAVASSPVLTKRRRDRGRFMGFMKKDREQARKDQAPAPVKLQVPNSKPATIGDLLEVGELVIHWCLALGPLVLRAPDA